MYLYHMTTSANRNLFHYHETEQSCAQGQHQNNKRNSVLYAKRLVYIAYEVRVSCKGPLRASLYVYSDLENQFYFFQTAPVVVKIQEIQDTRYKIQETLFKVGIQF